MTTTTTGTLYIALELGCDKWVLASATQAAEKPRFRTMTARNLAAFNEEIAKAKARFGLPADAPVCTCYEAGRDGFWLHRALSKIGITNLVVDASSIEVNRRQKQVKSDPVDAAKLVSMLCRYHAGERKVWSVVNVPSVADEDGRQLHRGMKDLQRQKTECSNRIKGLLASQGLTAAVDAKFRATLSGLRDWADQPGQGGRESPAISLLGSEPGDWGFGPHSRRGALSGGRSGPIRRLGTNAVPTSRRVPVAGHRPREGQAGDLEPVAGPLTSSGR